MALPVVAIVGRPNVGKSSLFNLMIRRRTSIVEPTAGVTRDRVSAICEVDDIYFELVDTGGHGIVDRDDLSHHVERQIQYALDQADFILFIVDGREGITPLDRQTAKLLRRYTDRVRLIANKVDEPHMAAQIGELVRLGFGEPFPVSAVNGYGRSELLELTRDRVASIADGPPAEPVLKVAIVGKRNAGKSTFVNALAGQDRVIVSEKPGTTRDSIDVRFEKDGRTIVAIDTAGLRKKSKLADDIEFFAYTRATRAVQRADVVFFLIDATIPVGQVDKRLGQLIVSEFKPCVLVVNKWDLAKGKASTDEYGEYLGKVLGGIDHAPIAFTSAKDSRNILSTIDLGTELFKQACLRVGTGQLNQILQDVLAGNVPRAKHGKKSPKLYYATQVATGPPTIVIFVNDPNCITKVFERFLLNRFRENLPYDEIPIRLVFRARRGRLVEGS